MSSMRISSNKLIETSKIKYSLKYQKPIKTNSSWTSKFTSINWKKKKKTLDLAGAL